MNYLLLGPEEGEKNEWLKREKEKVLREHPDAAVIRGAASYADDEVPAATADSIKDHFSHAAGGGGKRVMPVGECDSGCRRHFDNSGRGLWKIAVIAGDRITEWTGNGKGDPLSVQPLN